MRILQAGLPPLNVPGWPIAVVVWHNLSIVSEQRSAIGTYDGLFRFCDFVDQTAIDGLAEQKEAIGLIGASLVRSGISTPKGRSVQIFDHA